MHCNIIKGKNISSYFHLYSLKTGSYFLLFTRFRQDFCAKKEAWIIIIPGVRDLFDTEGWLHLVVESAPVSRVLTVSKWTSALVSGAWIPHVTGPSVDFARDGLLGEVGHAGGDVKVRLGIPWVVM